MSGNVESLLLGEVRRDDEDEVDDKGCSYGERELDVVRMDGRMEGKVKALLHWKLLDPRRVFWWAASLLLCQKLIQVTNPTAH